MAHKLGNDKYWFVHSATTAAAAAVAVTLRLVSYCRKTYLVTLTPRRVTAVMSYRRINVTECNTMFDCHSPLLKSGGG